MRKIFDNKEGTEAVTDDKSQVHNSGDELQIAIKKMKGSCMFFLQNS